MAEFLTTKGVSHQLEDIIIEAKKQLVLVSPYLSISKTFYERLKDAAGKKVEIKIIYGKDELKPNERNSLADLNNVELFYFENLHAKCYFNESKMVITSMNMYEFSEVNNREMGVLIDREKDQNIFEKALAETNSILQSAERILLKKVERRIYSTDSNLSSDIKPVKGQKFTQGYCIRCEARIDFNPTRPYCPECYSVWAQYYNEDYIENVCHCCGEYEETSMSKSQCYTCYSETASSSKRS